jgi:hypothetical protein
VRMMTPPRRTGPRSPPTSSRPPCVHENELVDEVTGDVVCLDCSQCYRLVAGGDVDWRRLTTVDETRGMICQALRSHMVQMCSLFGMEAECAAVHCASMYVKLRRAAEAAKRHPLPEDLGTLAAYIVLTREDYPIDLSYFCRRTWADPKKMSALFDAFAPSAATVMLRPSMYVPSLAGEMGLDRKHGARAQRVLELLEGARKVPTYKARNLAVACLLLYLEEAEPELAWTLAEAARKLACCRSSLLRSRLALKYGEGNKDGHDQFGEMVRMVVKRTANLEETGAPTAAVEPKHNNNKHVKFSC